MSSIRLRAALPCALAILCIVSLAAAGQPAAVHAAGPCPGGAQFGSSCVDAQAFGIYAAGGQYGCCYYPYDDASVGGTGQTSATATAPSGTAFASADLATGQLKAKATSTAGTGSGADGAFAEFQDTVTVIPPAGYSSPTIHVVLGMAVDANFQGENSSTFPSHLLTTLLAQISPYASAVGYYCLSSNGGGYPCPPNSASPAVAVAFDLPAASPSFTFDATLEVRAEADGLVDAADTGQLSLTLPAGVTYSSASGTLLSQGPKPADTTAPSVTITAHPANPTSRTAAGFSFSATDPDNAPGDLTFACKLDTGSFAPCTSPQSYAGPLADGTHTFAVHASDPAGNVSSDATYSWLVDTTPPLIAPSVSGTQGSNGWYTSNVGVSWTVVDAESGITTSSGCTPVSLTTDTAGTTYTCTAINGAGLTSAAAVTLRRDATPPSCTVTAAPSSVWPPNHKRVPVTLTVSVSDATSAPGPLTLISRTASGAAGDITGFDALGTPALSADGKTATYTIAGQVTANKDESYSVQYSAADQAGNVTACPTAAINVPHDQGQ